MDWSIASPHRRIKYMYLIRRGGDSHHVRAEELGHLLDMLSQLLRVGDLGFVGVNRAAPGPGNHALQGVSPVRRGLGVGNTSDRFGTDPVEIPVEEGFPQLAPLIFLVGSIRGVYRVPIPHHAGAAAQEGKLDRAILRFSTGAFSKVSICSRSAAWFSSLITIPLTPSESGWTLRCFSDWLLNFACSSDQGAGHWWEGDCLFVGPAVAINRLLRPRRSKQTILSAKGLECSIAAPANQIQRAIASSLGQAVQQLLP